MEMSAVCCFGRYACGKISFQECDIEIAIRSNKNFQERNIEGSEEIQAPLRLSLTSSLGNKDKTEIVTPPGRERPIIQHLCDVLFGILDQRKPTLSHKKQAFVDVTKTVTAKIIAAVIEQPFCLDCIAAFIQTSC